MSLTLGTYNLSTKTVDVTFTYQSQEYIRTIPGVLDSSNNYDPVGTLTYAEKLFSGFVYRSEFLALEASVYGGVLSPGQWVKLPGMYFIVINGTGLITIDTMDRSGNITTGVTTFSPTGSEQYEYLYFGPTASSIRATFTGSATAEVV